jgi:hypothetical protein
MLPDPLLQALDLPSVSSLTQPIPLANLDLQALLLQILGPQPGRGQASYPDLPLPPPCSSLEYFLSNFSILSVLKVGLRAR